MPRRAATSPTARRYWPLSLKPDSSAWATKCAAIDTAGDDCATQPRPAATACVRFTTQDAALLDLMFVVKRGPHSAALDDAFGRLFTAFDDLIRQGQQAGELQSGDPGRVRLLLLAAVLGIAALVTSGSIDARQTDALITDAVALFAYGSR